MERSFTYKIIPKDKLDRSSDSYDWIDYALVSRYNPYIPDFADFTLVDLIKKMKKLLDEIESEPEGYSDIREAIKIYAHLIYEMSNDDIIRISYC